jgi:beta-glucosidase
MNIHSSDFGEDFVWGVASSAYQTEGAYLEDGKGMSIWDVFTAVPGKESGHTACSFYHRYIQDIILMQYLNVKNFRFSISWSRIFPEGTGKVNEKGIEFYDRLIDFCLEQDITPWITLYHWDLPFALELKGGWTNREIVNWFSDYAELCVRKFGDRVKHWMILNEPMVFTGAGYFLGTHAPGKKGLMNFLSAAHHAAMCQGIGARVIKSYKNSLQVGTTLSCSPIDPIDESKSSKDAANRTNALANRLFIEPLLGMGYPWNDLKVLLQIQNFMQAKDEELMQFDMDFIGLQNYTREVVKHSSLVPYLNARNIKASKRGVYHTAMDWEVYPQGIYRMVKQFDDYKKIKKIIITENGAAFNDTITNGHVHDFQRINFYKNYLKQLLRAKREGAKVDGFFAWSFTDNFEWAEGFQKRFGLVYVDYATQRRIVKDSGFWYREFLEKQEAIIHAKAV